MTAPGADGWAFQATPWGFGCDGTLAALGDAAPVERGGRVVYERPELDEWYERTPRGLEQGFTLRAPPPCRREGAQGVVIALGAGLGAVVDDSGREARLHDATGKEVLRYSDLAVVDATGRALPAAIEARGTGLSIRFDDAGATYPVLVDPTIWSEEAKLVAPDPAGNGPEYFGTAVAAVGDSILVGSTYHNQNGAAYVFVGSGSTWNEQAELTVTNQEGFGTVLALHGDTALISGFDFGTLEGTVHVFLRSGTTWSEASDLNDPMPSACDTFGTSIAFDGTTAIVGASGAAHVFVVSGSTWTLQQTLVVGEPPDAGPCTLASTAVALSGDTAILSTSGVASVFVRSGTTWTLQQALTHGAPGNTFGVSLAIEGDTALVGSVETTQGPPGAVYVYARSGTSWTLAQEIASPLSLGSFGSAVRLSGGMAFVGEPSDPGTPMSTAGGTVYAYAPANGMFALAQSITPKETAAGDSFGTAVAVQGTTLVVGAPNSEAAYVFAGNGQPCSSSASCGSGNCVDGVCCITSACPGVGPCNAAEHCQAGTGTCSMTPSPTGTPCSSDGCSHGTCQNGVCVAPATVCAPPDACHDFGVCDSSRGVCWNPQKPDDAPCPDGTCMAGVCAPSATPPTPTPRSAGGCGCGVAPEPTRGPLGAGLALLVLLSARRRGQIHPRRERWSPSRRWRC